MMQWLKVWIHELVHGSTFDELDPYDRGVWITLLALSAEGRNPGIIELRPGVPYPPDILSNVVNIPVKPLFESIMRLEKAGRDEAKKKHGKVKTLPDGRVIIPNFKRYQTRYDKYYKNKESGIRMPADVCRVDKKRLEVEEIRSEDNKEEPYSAEFDKWFKDYPKNKNKKGAWRCWKQRKKQGHTAEYLTKCRDNYIMVESRNISHGFAKAAAVFLGRDEHFKDYEKPPPSPPSSREFTPDYKRDRDTAASGESEKIGETLEGMAKKLGINKKGKEG